MEDHTIRYGDEEIAYRVLEKERISGKISVLVQPDGRITVEVPIHTSSDKVRDAVRKRARWISGHLTKIRARQIDVLPRKYVSGESHYYLGRSYQLKVHIRASMKPDVKLLRGQLRVTVPKKDSKIVRKALYSWYRKRAHDYFTRRLAEIAPQAVWIRNELPMIKLLNMKKQWGSCSPAGVILLNPHLAKAPRDCIDYVISHELCHLKERNHSPKFWRLLSGLYPDWKRTKARLDDMAETILNH